MQRLRRVGFPLSLIAALALAIAVTVDDSAADLDNLVFTSRQHHLRIVVPRGWRASELPAYPNAEVGGLLLWMARSQPAGQIELTSEPFTRELYCSWPKSCQLSRDGFPAKYACALRSKLEAARLRVGQIQPGPKENETAGLPSIWFEYDDGRHFLRQAIAFSADRAISLVLSSPTSEARATHTRAFEQALRTLHLLSAEEAARVEGIDAAIPIPPGDASTADAASLIDGRAGSAAERQRGSIDAAVLDGGVALEPAPAPNIDPVGPCPS